MREEQERIMEEEKQKYQAELQRIEEQKAQIEA